MPIDNSVIKHNAKNIEHKGDKRMCAMLYIQGKEHHTKHEKKGKKVSADPQHSLVFHPSFIHISLVLANFLTKEIY